MDEKYIYNVNISINNWKNNFIFKNSCENRIKTTRYTWYSFVPVVLFEQFLKISNFYFLVSLLINALIDAPVPFGLNVIPLILVIIFAMLMRSYEDINRFYADKEINDQICYVLKGTIFESCFSESIAVGDIIRCDNNCAFPADLLLLFSSRDTNECSVTTVNLDGESNLKTFFGTVDRIDEENINNTIIKNQWEVYCIDPNEDLHQFHGKLLDKNTSDDEYLLTEKNLLLRGSCLKNTAFIVGCVIYAGCNTKLSLNSRMKTLKMSSVDKRLHYFIIFYLSVQVVLSLICGIVWNVLYFTTQWTEQNWYIPVIRIAAWKRVEGFFAFYILYNRFVPISIIFATYYLKAFSTFFFNVDLQMYDPDCDQKAKVNTIELLEELGQIEYIFCDKTGTLTENKMKFQRCGFDETEYIDVDEKLHILEDNEIKDLNSCYVKELQDLFLCLSICHTVKVSNEDGLPNTDFSSKLDLRTLLYQASSPDELAFLEAMRNYGITYLGNEKTKHWLSVFGSIEVYNLREVLEFDSDRKCMSVIVDCPDGTIKVICKGAECSLFTMAENTSKIDIFMKHLALYSESGLRILVVGKKTISTNKALEFSRKLAYYRSSPILIKKESEIYNEIENKLTLVGVTGIEDKLQEGVSQTIKDLRAAGIKVWIITGDKEETAVNISLSAGHISHDMYIIRLTGIESEEECLEKLKSLVYLTKSSLNTDQKYALVVDGKSFAFLIKPVMVEEFTDLCASMNATLCCRMNPLQKAQTVKMIKDHVKPTPITAAIGDGGNDVSMILEAHVGIGIFGKEGRQAVRVADYAIGKFCFLRRAIFIHGQNLYINIARLIDFYFYKSALYVFPLFLFCIFSAFSMLNIFDSISVALYNVTYSTLPPITFALFDKSLPDHIRLRKPYLYQNIQRNKLMTFNRLFKSFFLAFVQSIIIFFIIYIVFSQSNGIVSMKGYEESYLYFGLIIFYSLWLVTLVKLFLISDLIVFANIGIFLCNILLCLIIQIIFQYIVYTVEYKLTIQTLREPFAWLLMLVTILLCSTVDVILKVFENRGSSNNIPKPKLASFKYQRTE